MACVAALVAGCPTNGDTRTIHGVTHAMVTTLDNSITTRLTLPAHVLQWSDITHRWMALEASLVVRWAAHEQ